MIIKCLRCKRTLSNKISIEREYGPSCFKKIKKEQEVKYKKLTEF